MKVIYEKPIAIDISQTRVVPACNPGSVAGGDCDSGMTPDGSCGMGTLATGACAGGNEPNIHCIMGSLPNNPQCRAGSMVKQ